MYRALLAVPLVTLAAPVEAKFAPRLDQHYRYVTTETRDNGAAQRRFTVTRDLVFRRDADGYVAEITVLPSNSVPTEPAQAMFDTAYAALAGIPIRIRLSADGVVTGVEDEVALWTRLLAAITQMARKQPARARLVAALTKGLTVLPADRRRAMLASGIVPVIAADAADQPPGMSREVSLPAATPEGDAITVPAREAVTSGPTGLLRIATRGETAFTLPDTPAARILIDRVREIDPVTGLVLSTREDRTTELIIDGLPRRQTIRQERTLTPSVS